MNILILGATGFVGQSVTRLLLVKGYNVICAGRNTTALKHQFPQAQLISCNFLKDTSINDWLPRLAGIDVIINCVGIFYHSDKKMMWNIHFHVPKALYSAAQHTSIRQIIHLSALGIDSYDNDYANSKRAIENFLKTLTIPHVLLRPSLIYGPCSKGGMEVLKKLAACPGLIPLPESGSQLLQPIQVSDLAHAINNLILNPPLHSSVTLAAVSSQRITLKDMVVNLRQWLGFGKGVFIKIPFALIKIIGRVGDLGSFSTVNTSAVNMLKRGNYATQQEVALFQKIACMEPLDFAQGLNLNPALKEERWYVRLLLMRPLLRISLAIMWLFSALTSILPYSQTASHTLLSEIGIATSLQSFILYGASFLNALIGFSLLVKYKTKKNCLFQLFVIAVYSLIITIKLPYLWLEPFGPIVKNIPILLSVCILYILES